MAEEWLLPGGVVPGSTPRNPVTVIPMRQPGSVRRTAHVNMAFALKDGAPQASGTLVLQGAARDLVTRAGDTTLVAAEAAITAEISAERKLRHLEITPGGSFPSLEGVSIAQGYRERAIRLWTRDLTEPAGMLLMDVSGTGLISRYSMARVHAQGLEPQPEMTRRGPLVNICSGWREGGVAATAVLAGHGPPLDHVPLAPALLNDDALALHDLGQVRPLNMRRLRRIDLIPQDDSVVIDAHHRDTFVEADGQETILHEYTLRGSLRRSDLEFLELESVARVLPFPDCSLATREVERLLGTRAGSAPRSVREHLPGILNCTHLNDLLSNLGAIPYMLGHLRAH